MSIMNRINYIKDLNVMGCAAPDFYIAVETGFAAAAPALLSLFVPGCTDIVKMKLGLSPWHAKGIRSMIKGAAPPFSAGANKWLYKVGYFTAERGLYYFMLADVTTEFFVQWQSLAFVAEQCELPSAGTAYGYIATYIYTPMFEGPLGITPLHNVTGMANGLAGVTIFPGFQGSVAFSVQWDSWPERGQGVAVDTWTVETDTGAIIMPYSTGSGPGQFTNETAGHFSFDTTRALVGKSYEFKMRNNGDKAAQAVAGSYTVSMAGHPTGVLPFGCKPKKTSVPFT
jgi:hypothetical protein